MTQFDLFTIITCSVLILMSIVTSMINIFFRKVVDSEPLSLHQDNLEDETREETDDSDYQTHLPYPPISVVLYAHDNARDLERHLPAVLTQDYPADYEVIVVESKGEDDTDDVLKKLKQEHSNLYTTFVPDSARYMSRPKLAITLGVKAAKHGWILLTDPVFHPQSDQWLKAMARNCSAETDIIIGYSNFNDEASDYKRFERLLAQCYIMREAQRHTAYRCDPGNLMFRKEMFIEGRSYDGNLKFIRGEYDFIVNKFARKGNTATETSQDTWMIEDAPQGKTWLNSHLFYMETRKHLMRKMSHRIRYVIDQSALHLNIILIIAALAMSVTQGMIQGFGLCSALMAGCAIAALVITLVLRSLFASLKFRQFGEDIPLWKILPFELSVVWRHLANNVRYRMADKYDFISHKV